MPQNQTELLQKIRDARVASFNSILTLRCQLLPDQIDIITFVDGEIDSVTFLDRRYFKIGQVVTVDTHYTGKGTAVIIKFIFGTTNKTVVISRGGAVGEMTACVDFSEITLFPKPDGTGNVVLLAVA